MRPRRGGIVIPTLVAGVGLALSLPPWGWWFLAFPSAAIFYRRLEGLPLRSRILAGWMTGIGCYGIGLFWAEAFNWYGAVVLIALESLALAGAAGMTTPRLGRLPSFVGANVLFEALRMSWPFGGLPIGGVFLGQADGPLVVLARIGGPTLLTAAVWAGGAVLGELATVVVRELRPLLARRASATLDARAGQPDASRHPGRPAGISAHWPLPVSIPTLAALAALIGFTSWAAVAPDGGPPVGHLRVAAVQGGGRRGTSATEVPPAQVFSAQLAATAELHRRLATDPPPAGHVALVVWPEDVIALDRPLAGSGAAATMGAVAKELRATVVAGVTIDTSATTYRNEAVAWAPSGRIVASYEKVHRVPFGEYVPFRGFFSHLANLSAVPRDAIPGHGSGLMRTPAGPLGILVSYEVFFASRGRAATRAGAEMLVVPTNTSSYATSQIPTEELAADRVQSVAEGRDLVQASPTGYSALVTNGGTIVARTVLGARAILVGALGLRTGATVYERVGDLPVLLGAACALVGGWATGWSTKKRRSASRSMGRA